MIHKLSPLILLLIFSCSAQKEESKTEVEQVKEATPDTSVVATPLGKTDDMAFRSLKFLTGKVEVSVPEQLQLMDKKMFELKYPYENPTTTIAYGDEDATVSLLISPRQDKATQADLPKYQQMLNNSFSNNPSIDFKKSEIKNINGRDFIVIEMITPAADTRVYNIMFVTSLEGKLLMNTFNCTVEKMKEWQPIAEKILSSVKVKD